MTKVETERRNGQPPTWFWLLPLTAVLMRGAPYLLACFGSASDGQQFAPTGYIPRDFFSYAAFIRQAAEHGRCLFWDPYTIEAQQPRFILLLHWILGGAVRVTGWDAMLVLELARIPLVFLFFLTVWKFSGMLLHDRKQQLWAAALVGFSGGVEGFLLPHTQWAPPFVADRFREGVWHLYGWNTFQSMFNPLWIAGLTLTLWLIMAAWDRRRAFSRRSSLLLSLGLIAQFYIHPYSALATLTILGAVPIAAWVLGRPCDWRRTAWIGAMMSVALGVIAAISVWQAHDPVYHAAANNVIGPLDLSVFWYPLTLGLVGAMALRTWARWAREQQEHLELITGWVAAIILLHASPVLNGYHFVFHLHLPIALLAAPSVAEAFQRARTAQRGGLLATAALAVGLFASCFLTTGESLGDIQRRNATARRILHGLGLVKTEPPGRVLAPAELGNLVPAYGPHRVWVGHWFLTPDYRGRRDRYQQLISDTANTEPLYDLVLEGEFDYIVAPRAVALSLAKRLPAASLQSHGDWTLVVRRPLAN